MIFATFDTGVRAFECAFSILISDGVYAFRGLLVVFFATTLSLDSRAL